MKRSTALVLIVLAGAAGWAGYTYRETGKLPFGYDLPQFGGQQAGPGGGPRGPGGPGGRRGGGGFGDPPPSVIVQAPRIADVPVTIDAVGTVTALRTVTVRAQTDGRLIAVNFREGQMVKAGDVLARIDPTVAQAQLDQVVAKKAQDEALLANARLDLARYIRLANDNSGSRQQADTQRALVAQYEAQVALDQAAIDNARAVLAYTTIVSPIDGRTGLRLIDEGNVIQSSSTTGLVVVAQVDPISVAFSVPQQQLRAVIQALARGKPKTEIINPENGQVQDTGTLEVIDNQIDQTTGTVKLKAVFRNDPAHLWPGQYVAIKLEVDTLTGVTTVPGEAVQRGPQGPFVYVLKEDGGSVGVRRIQITREAENIAVITGVGPQDRVVTTGFARLSDGARVRVADPAANPPPGRPQGAETALGDAPAEAQPSTATEAPAAGAPRQRPPGAGQGRRGPGGEGRRGPGGEGRPPGEGRGPRGGGGGSPAGGAPPAAAP